MGAFKQCGVMTLVLVALAGERAWGGVTAVVRTGATTNTCTPSVAPLPLDENSLTFCDRVHIYKEVPSLVKGAQYILLSNTDRNVADYQLKLTLDSDGTLFLFIDNRVGDNTNTNPPTLGGAVMSWVADQGFVDTDIDIGIDEGADGTINQRFSIYQLDVLAGDVLLLQQNDGTSRNNYGVAFMAPVAAPAASTFGLLALAIVLLGAGALALRRRSAHAC